MKQSESGLITGRMRRGCGRQGSRHYGVTPRKRPQRRWECDRRSKNLLESSLEHLRSLGDIIEVVEKKSVCCYSPPATSLLPQDVPVELVSAKNHRQTRAPGGQKPNRAMTQGPQKRAPRHGSVKQRRADDDARVEDDARHSSASSDCRISSVRPRRWALRLTFHTTSSNDLPDSATSRRRRLTSRSSLQRSPAEEARQNSATSESTEPVIWSAIAVLHPGQPSRRSTAVANASRAPTTRTMRQVKSARSVSKSDFVATPSVTAARIASVTASA